MFSIGVKITRQGIYRTVNAKWELLFIVAYHLLKKLIDVHVVILNEMASHYATAFREYVRLTQGPSSERHYLEDVSTEKYSFNTNIHLSLHILLHCVDFTIAKDSYQQTFKSERYFFRERGHLIFSYLNEIFF